MSRAPLRNDASDVDHFYGMSCLSQRTDDYSDDSDDDERDGDTQDELSVDGSKLEALESLADLRREVDDCERREAEFTRQLACLDALWERRREPLLQEVERARSSKDQAVSRLQTADKEQMRDIRLPPGPSSLAFVDSSWFAAACNIVVTVNLACMASAVWKPQFSPITRRFLDHGFLLWYIAELSLKFGYYKRLLFIGKVSVVWWNWLDLGIVISGILDQFIAIVSAIFGATMPLNLGFLKILRAFRVVRCLKLLKAVLLSDFAWTQSPTFELFISGVIAVNTVVMALELDVEWQGWTWVNHIFLAIYLLELFASIKHQRCKFFACGDMAKWNYLDFVIVGEGVLDSWLIPIIVILRSVIWAIPADRGAPGGSLLPMMKLLRIFRMLRLVKLIKHIKPLYSLLVGVMQALRAMQWVMILTLLTLYAGATVFTTVVKEGFLYGDAPPEEALESFGSVGSSFYSLFKLMNGDTDVVAPLVVNVYGRLLFAAFLVLSNWAILAILTSVVSDHMIAASSAVHQADKEQRAQDDFDAQMHCFKVVLDSIDHSGNGSLCEGEWSAMLQNEELCAQISELTDMGKEDLQDLFLVIAAETSQGNRVSHKQLDDKQGPVVDIQHFIELFRSERSIAETTADKRSVVRLRTRMRLMETSIEKKLDQILSMMGTGAGRA